MKRVIVDYSKLTSEILNLLVEKFPDGYDDSDIIRFKNAKNETIEAVEVKTEDTIYLVKVSTKLADRIENYDEDDDIENGGDDSLDALKELEIDSNDDDDDDKPSSKEDDVDADDEDDDEDSESSEDDDEDDEDE
ncbi:MULTISPECIES: DNA primase [Flavobacterium]|uniref:DNA primase n=1 Tax=Flavobacterium hankyongi TaxID=1176532 RepID=A0ABP8ZJL5_9FLAO|nr:DNA primase [Flavobacterium sp. N1846]